MKRQWKRRLLAMLLTLTMLLSLVPSAFAQDGESGEQGLTWKQADNSTVSAPLGREEVQEPEEPEEGPLYDENEQVRVSIVLKGDPTLALYSLASGDGEEADAMAYREELQAYQEAAAEAISEEALDKQPLDVVWNLTLAANIISANVEYGQIGDIQKLDYVEDVILETRYEIQGFQVEDDPNLVISTGMTNTVQAWDEGYSGAGMRIAIIDTGLDIHHQSFNNDAFLEALSEAAEEDGRTLESYDLLDAAEIRGVLKTLNAYAKRPAVTAQDLYRTEKLPFCFNYIDGDLDVTHENDLQGDHGSHVAGIAAANRYLKQADGSFASAMDKVKMTGNAPEAQVLVMKVFGKGGGAYDSDYMAAIEDAVALHCDSVNLSLGSAFAGMAIPAVEKYQGIMDNLANTDTVVNISAGNNSYWAVATNTSFPYSDDVNFNTSGSPGSYANALTVASVENNGMVIGGGIVAYDRSMGYGEYPMAGIASLASMDVSGAGTDYEFVYLDSFGAILDYFTLEDEGVDTADKIILCNRGGGINFSDKANWAVEWGGAAAVIICDNVSDGTLYLDPTDYLYTVPYVSISLDDALFIKENAEKHSIEDEFDYYTGTLTITSAPEAFPGTDSYETMSSFSSWGVPGDLSLKPEITAPGGGIWSLEGTDGTHSSYQTMSGTSMSAPQITGIGALVKQYIENNGLSAKTSVTDRALAQSLMMSTARPLVYADAEGNEYYYSVFQQGAGMVDTRAAVNADSYILMDSTATSSWEDGKVKAELGDGTPDSYTVKFTINNLDGVEHSYTLSADVFTQAIAADEAGKFYLHTSTMPLNAAVNWTWDGKKVDTDRFYDFNGDGVVNLADGNALLDVAAGLRTRDSLSHKDLLADFMTGNSINSYTGYEFLRKLEESTAVLTVPANGSVTVTAVIALDPASVAQMEYYCPNGFYVEAYLKAGSIATEEGALGTSHSIPVLGFYGNWTDPSMFERGSALDYIFDVEAGVEEFGYPYLFDGTFTSMFANRLMYQKADDNKTFYYFGGNPWIDDDEYLPERNAFSSTSGDKFTRWNYTAIRNAIAGRLLIENSDGTVYKETDLGRVTAAYYHPNTGYWYNTGSVASVSWTGTDAGGNALPDGTEVRMSLALAPELYLNDDGSIDWDSLGKGASKTMTLTIDNTAPELRGAAYDPAEKTLTLTVWDNLYTAYVALTNAAGTRIVSDQSPNQALNTKNQEIAVTFDMSNVAGKEFKVVLGDYANNQVTYDLTGGFDPGMDLSPDIDAYYYGYNQASGEWVAYNKDCTEYAVIGYGLNTIAGDIDNAFLTAGAYARGYVFAADDGGSFYAFPVDEETPMVNDGLEVSSNVGLVYDMAYDGSDMYLASGADLYKVDLLTGRRSYVGAIIDYASDVISCALAFDDEGNLYSLVYYEFWDENEDGDFELALVSELNRYDGVDLSTKTKIADMDVAGDAFNWLTWDSSEDELVLSAGSNYFGEWVGYDFVNNLYTVDPATGEAELKAELTPKGQQLTALFVTPDGADKIPASAAATDITLSERSLYVAPGASMQLTTVVKPWNLANKGVTWSSSDPTVVSVDQSGKVKALKGGTATITVTSDATPSVKAACEIEVAKLDQQLNALIWTDHVDWASFPVADPGSWEAIHESDQIFASATMGEDGFIYAATLNPGAETSELYKVDPATYKSTLLGTIGEVYGGIFVADLAVVPGTGWLLGLYGNNIVVFNPEHPEDVVYVWDLFEMGWQTFLVGAAYLGENTITEERWYIDEETDELVWYDVEYNLHVYALVDYYGGVFYFAFTDEGESMLDLYNGETDRVCQEVWYSSAVWAYNTEGKPTLFWSYFDSDVCSELLAIDLDSDRLTLSLLDSLGEFGDNAWPVVGLMTANTPGLPASAVDMLNSGGMKRMSAAHSVSKLGSEAAYAAEKAAGTAAVAEQLPDDLETQRMSVSSDSGFSAINNSGAVTVQVALDKASTNGLIEVSYDSSELELIEVTGKATLNSANTYKDGKVILAYAYREAAEADTVVAELTFSSKTKLSTSVLLTTLEDGLETPDASVSVPINFPVSNNPPSNPAPGVSKPGTPTPTVPTEPEPAEPDDPTEPVTPSAGISINVPEAPAAEEIPAILAPYADLDSDGWYSEYAAYVISNGLMGGTGGDAFSPNVPLTRGMLVTILHRAAGAPAVTDAAGFVDVADGAWYAGGVAWAALYGLVNGYSDDTFRPNADITRQELAVILWRLAQQMGINVGAGGATLPDLPDRNEIASWAAEAMSWAYRVGILTGYSDGSLAPTDGATRMEAATMIVRFLKVLESSQEPAV